MSQPSGPPRRATGRRNHCVKIKRKHQGSSERESISVLNRYQAGPSGTQLTETVLQIQELIPASTRPLKRRREDCDFPSGPGFTAMFSPDFDQPLPDVAVSETPDLPALDRSLPSPSHPHVDPGRPPTTESHKASSKAKKTAGDKLNDASRMFNVLLKWMLARETHPGVAMACHACKAPNSGLYRCRECIQCPALCRACMCAAHILNPFHWVEEWNGSFFERRDLSLLGYCLPLGHYGQACPDAPSRPEAHYIVVTHTNGIHDVIVHECHCANRLPFEEQLLRATLVPSTWIKPQSAFTIEMLNDSHLDALMSKKPAYDYVCKLNVLSDNSETRSIHNRYREFMFVSRQWRYLQMMKRAGICHGLVYPNRDCKLLTIPCFSCPWPGVNLPDDWKEATPPPLRYLYRIFLGVDGNHSLQKKTKPGDDTDYSLVGNDAFFKDVGQLKDFLKKFPKDTAKVIVTCTGFRVVRAQRTGKFRNLDYSGVVAVSCIRHGCFRARAMVNLFGGEQFPLVDLALSGALEGAEGLVEWLLTYDVGCQYLVNINSRWEEWGLPDHLRPLIQELQILLPQLHMLAHQEHCQTEYAMCYKRGCGHTCGEMVEVNWAENNAVGLSTREMNAGARQDAICDHLNAQNWRKNVTRAKYLQEKLRKKLLLQLRHTLDLVVLTKEAGLTWVEKWVTEDIDDEAPTPSTYQERKKHPKPSVYILDETRFPSKSRAVKDLIDRGPLHTPAHLTRAHELSNPAHDHAAEDTLAVSLLCLKNGIEIELEQQELRDRVDRYRATLQGEGVTSDKVPGLGHARRALDSKLKKWRQEQQQHLPQLGLLDEDAMSPRRNFEDDLENLDMQPDSPERECLGLPSEWKLEWMDDEHDSLLVASWELSLRIGHAYDVLATIRSSVRQRAALIKDKQKNARGQKDNLRTQAPINTVAARARFLADVYNVNLSKMHHLQVLLAAHPQSPCSPTTLPISPSMTETPQASPNPPPSTTFRCCVPIPAIPTNLKRIDVKKDLHARDLTVARTSGDSKATLSWIFQVSGPQATLGKGQEDWESETMRTDWFRARAAKARTDEEVNLLYADGRATRRGFTFAANLWKKHANLDASSPFASSPNDLISFSTQGARAYALQKSKMFFDLAQQCEVAIQRAHHVHRVSMRKMEDDDGSALKKIFAEVQEGIVLNDSRLDYALVSF